MKYPLAPNGVFWTIQGEGAMRGTPMVFIRLAGCSVGCPGCDTDYRVAERVSVDEILARVLACAPVYPTYPDAHIPRWAWVTGGEPTDHDLVPLIDGLRAVQRAVALATSGVRSTAGLDTSFLSVSPHTQEWAQRSGTELKVVPLLNGFDLNAVDQSQLRFGSYFLQPLWMNGREDPTSLQQCVRYVLDHPKWSLTDQGHKRWDLP